MPPINPTPHPYLRVTWICALGHMGGGNSCDGDTCWGLLRHTLANRSLVYPSQGEKYHAEGCMALKPLSIGAPLGKLEERFVYQGLRETVKEGSGNGSDCLSVWGLCKGNLEGQHLYWGYWRKALEMGVFLHRGSAVGPGRGCCLTRVFEKKIRF